MSRYDAVRLLNVSPDDPVWPYVRHCGRPGTLVELADSEAVTVGPVEADRMLDYLRDLGVQDGTDGGRVVVAVA